MNNLKNTDRNSKYGPWDKRIDSYECTTRKRKTRGIGFMFDDRKDSGLSVQKKSVFEDKLKTFLADLDADEQQFVKNALNRFYLGLKNEFGGYIEGKRPTIKDLGSSKVMFWKIQSTSPTGSTGSTKPIWYSKCPSDYNLMKKFWVPLDKAIHPFALDGNSYYGISRGLEVDDKRLQSTYAMDHNFHQEQEVIVGVDCIADTKWQTSKSMDKSINGDTFRIIISVPNAMFRDDSIPNRCAEPDGRTLSNELCTVSYNPNSKKIRGADLTDSINEPRFYTTKKTGLDTGWKKLMLQFDEYTKMDDCMTIISQEGVITHFYYAID